MALKPQVARHDEILTPAQCGPTPPERNDTIPTAIGTGLSSASPGTYTACGVIGDNNHHILDVDMFRVEVNAGDFLEIDIDAEAFGSSLDSALRIFDALGHPLAADDDALSGGFDSHLEFFAQTTGTYYVGVGCSINVVYDPFVAGTGNFANSTGEYTVEIKVGPPPAANPIAVTVAQGEQRTGLDLASSRLGAITGQMFVDSNGNRQQDAGEPGVDGQFMFLTLPGGVGTVADARLSANVALLNSSPTFTGTVNAQNFVRSGTGLTGVGQRFGTGISSAPYTIAQPGSYFLTTNLTVSSGNAITIAANSVTLDLNGFTISSTAPAPQARPFC